MIKLQKDKYVLYTKDGKRKLAEYKFKTERGKKGAKSKAEKRERQIEYFKHRRV